MKSYLFCSVFIFLIFTSCAPSFNFEKERENILTSLGKLSSPEKRVDIFYPDSFNKDSLKNILKENKDLLDVIQAGSEKSTVKINNVSSAITIQNRLFRIVNATETSKLNLKHYMLSVKELKQSLDNNLINYVENDHILTITKDSDFIAIYHGNSWEYFNFNVSMMYHAYGLVDTKKLVKLYYDEVFIPAEEKWDAESIRDFKEIYGENKDLPQYKNLDFDAYCDCLIRHEEKLEPEKILETNYYESDTRLNVIYQCRILTTRE
ncbi:hypothetical protein [Kordia sp. SMS9]|uniref:hypothetical protein n=1 Tax=Kordia sp. SMS9 TaxID=2282170 RepID=UPI000E0CE484|nr:hypothetical protein [Kordia sp. SMS9]